jgi:hypothetical protein
MYSLALDLVEMDMDPDVTESLSITLVSTYLILNSHVRNVTAFSMHTFFD